MCSARSRRGLLCFGYARNSLFSSSIGMKSILIIALLLLFVGAAASEAAVVYVKHDAAGANNGSSWADAYTLLQSALDDASSGDEIWVAAGTYYPTSDYGRAVGDREKHFQMKNGVGIYGGFTGAETERSQRYWKTNLTILSGDIGTSGNASDNCYNVFYHYGYDAVDNPGGIILDASAVLDGFTITGGHAEDDSGEWWQYYGAGMFNCYVSPTIKNCHFDDNYAYFGGGIYNYYSGADISDCIFTNNDVDYYGGGIYNDFANPTITNCIFSLNTASYGGGIDIDSYSILTLTNCFFVNNYANYGGAIDIYYSQAVITNCTISGNTAEYGGGIYTSNSDVSLNNTILWGNTAGMIGQDIIKSSDTTITYNYCDIAGSGGSGAGWNVGFGTDGGGNIDADPLFVDAANDDLRLQADSACIDAGDNDLVPAGITTDLDGNPRIAGAAVDMGAYELATSLLFVKHDATGTNDGSSWADAFVLLQSALDVAESGDNIWVAAGTYYPTSDYGLDIGDRGMHFRMKDGVGIYGGFAGAETKLSQRNWKVNETILSGDIGTPGDNSDNCYHVFINGYDYDLDNSAIIDGFTITGGNADHPSDYNFQLGGGFYNYFSSITVANCIIIGNNAGEWGGGGMFNYYSDPLVTNCDFKDNTSDYYGGGMFNEYSSPIVTGCRFENNSAAYGGGMLSYTYSDPIITDCDFIGNTALSYGGGMLTYNDSNPTITNCIFIGNSAGQYGGGMELDEAVATLTNCLFAGNSSWYGGGMDIIGGDVQLINCTFSGNSADYGGGIAFIYYADSAIKNTILWGNSAFVEDNEIYISDYNLSNPTFSNCDIAGSGGSGAGWNTAMGTDGGGNIDADPIFSNAANDDLRIVPGSPSIDAGENNSVPGGVTTDLAGNPRIVDGNDDTNAIVDMGAYEYQGSRGLLVKHDAPGADNGSSWNDAFLLLQSALNEALPGDEIWVAAGTYYPTYDYGLDISDRGKHFRMINGVGIYGGFAGTETERDQRDWETNVTILSGDIGTPDDNSDNCYHVFYHPDGTNLDATSLLDGFTITNGNADGGGLHYCGAGMLNYASSPDVYNCSFNDNYAEIYGGGIYNEYSNAVFSNCSIIGNSSGSHGGGIYNTNSTVSIIESAFIDNVAGGNGGGIRNFYSPASIVKCIFMGNDGFNGGGICNRRSSPSIRECQFISNLSFNGGGIYNDDDNAEISQSVFSDNSASLTGGGGIFNYFGAPDINNCLFYENDAGSTCMGGGILNWNSNSAITNCSLRNNYGGYYGGGIANYYSNSVITNCSLSENEAEYGGGIYNEQSAPTINNTILWGNIALNDKPELDNSDEESIPVVSHCNIAGCGGSAAWNADFGTDGGGNIDADPIFSDSANDDLRILSGSPSIDAGDNTLLPPGVTTDLDGNDRIIGAAVDMGAYELQAIISSVWGVNASNNIYVRIGITPDNPKGEAWQRIPGPVREISVGPRGVWGVNRFDRIYYRPSLKADNTPWALVDGYFIRQVSAGPTGELWGVMRWNGKIYRRTGITEENPTGTGWQLIPGSLSHIAVGARGVWGVNSNNRIYYRDSIIGDATPWLNVPGVLKSIAIGPTGEVWGVNPSGYVYFRKGISEGNPTGTHWVQRPGRLEDCAVGDVQMWGANSSAHIYFRASCIDCETPWERINGMLRVISVGGVAVTASTDSSKTALIEKAEESPEYSAPILLKPTISNQPPVADAGGDRTVQANMLIRLNGAGSFDPDGEIVLHEWDLTGDGRYESHGMNTTTIFYSPGNYTIRLCVTDDDGATGVDSAVIRVR